MPVMSTTSQTGVTYNSSSPEYQTLRNAGYTAADIQDMNFYGTAPTYLQAIQRGGILPAGYASLDPYSRNQQVMSYSKYAQILPDWEAATSPEARSAIMRKYGVTGADFRAANDWYQRQLSSSPTGMAGIPMSVNPTTGQVTQTMPLEDLLARGQTTQVGYAGAIGGYGTTAAGTAGTGTGTAPSGPYSSTEAILREIAAMQQQQAEQYASQNQLMQQQYQDVMQAYQTREDQLSSMMAGYGDQERAQVEQQRQQAMASMQQDLLRRGLTSSTAYDAAMRGVQQVSQQALSSINERLNRERMGYMSALSGERLQAAGELTGMQGGLYEKSFAARGIPGQTLTTMAGLMSEERQAELNRQAQMLLAQKDTAIEYARLAQAAQQAALDRKQQSQQFATTSQMAKKQHSLDVAQAQSQYVLGGGKGTIWSPQSQNRFGGLVRS